MRSGRILAVVCASLWLGTAHAEGPEKLWTERSFAKPLDPDGPVSMRAFSTLAKELSPAVVNISVERKQRPMMPFMQDGGTSLGTGFIIQTNGLVLTNNHVIADGDTITVRLSNEHEYPAKVVGTYLPLDVALLKIEPNEPGKGYDAKAAEWKAKLHALTPPSVPAPEQSSRPGG